jgi:hypothetical protein
MCMSPNSYESRLYKFFVKSKNPQSESVSSRGSHYNLVLSCSPNPTSKTCWIWTLSFLAPKVTWWSGGEYWEDLGLVPNQFLWSSIFSI